jgi:uncharacterized Zn finger protein (UPF0148 family)
MDNVFRIKKMRDSGVKSKVSENVSGTLDSIHQNIVSSMKEITINIEDLKLREIEIEKELENMTEVYNLTKLQDELRTIKNRLAQDDPLKDYYLKNADIMLNYYNTADKSQAVSTSLADQNTFVKYLNVSKVQETPAISKKDLFEEFTSRMKLNTGEVTEKVKESAEHCEKCNIAREELSEDGILVCPRCGSEEYMLVVSDFPSFRDPPKERNNYAYKKINHLNEILNQFQAKESTIIPDEVMNEVVLEVKKRRIQNVADLSEIAMREILKKLNRSKYYEHATHILSRLNGNPPPTITPEIEEKVRAMFQEIQAPFLLFCPDDRTNFLSYSYILYKFFELLELDEYKVYFPLLKSRDRLIAHDIIWEKICSYLHWEFIRSV